MKKMIAWLRESNRWKHLVGGGMIGFASDDAWCATLAGVASALEYKHWAHAGAWDWIDWGLTVSGGIVVYGSKWMNL